MRSSQQRKKSSRIRKTRLVMRTRTKISTRKVIVLAVTTVLLITSGLTVFFNLSNTQNSYAASSGDYRTKATGNWNSTSTWEKYNGSNWVNATSTPTYTDGAIEILSGHTVTITTDVTIDQTTIDQGGAVVINASRYLYEVNGSGISNDLIVNGTLTIKSSGYLTQNTTSTIVVNGTIVAASGSIHQLGTGSTITINDGGRYRDDGATITATAGNWIVNSGGVYQDNRNGNSLPIATWNTGSTCEITGVTTGVPGNLDQSFYNFTWNCTSQSGNCDFTGHLTSINGDFTVANTGTKYIRLKAGSSSSSVAGNYIQTGGTFNLSSSNNASSTFTVAGDFVQSGGTFAGGIGNNCTGTVNVAGDWNLTGGTLTVGGNPQASTEIVFNKPGIQTFAVSGTSISGNVNFTVNSGTTLDLGTSVLSGTGDFTLQSGAGLAISSSHGITSSGASGQIQVTGSRSFNAGADYLYNGTSAQNSGNGLPSTVHNLTINNLSGLTLSNDLTVSNILTITSGKITTGSNDLSVSNTSVASITGYNSTNYVVGNLRRSVSGTGSYDFPLGTSSNYELLNITLNGATGFTSILGGFTNANPLSALLPLLGLTISGTSITDLLDYGYWSLTPNTSMTGGSYSVTLNEKGQSNAGSTAASHCVLKRSGLLSSWQSVGTHSNATQALVGGIVTAARSGLTSFSQYAIGKGSGALPIELIYFNAKLSDHHVDLSWATASELNNDFFTVERSTDGTHFEEVLRKQGAGNSTTTLYYTDADENPLHGYSYYRLKQTDFDGHYTYSEIKTVKDNSKLDDEADLKITSVAPNPFSERFTVSFLLKVATNVEFQLYNSSGQLVYKFMISTNDGMNQYDFIDELGLTPGMYIMNLVYNNQKVTQKIIKK